MAAAKAVNTPVVEDDIDTSKWTEGNLSIDAWYHPEKSKTIVGRALEAVQVQTAFGPQDVVKVKLGRAAIGIAGKGEDAETVEMKKGDVIAVRVSMNLAILLELVENKCAVEIIPTGKIKTSGGKREMWRYRVRFHGVRAPLINKPAQVVEQPGSQGVSNPVDDEEIPF